MGTFKVKICAHCGSNFNYKSSKKKYCNKSCAASAYHLVHRDRRKLKSKAQRLANPRKIKDRKLKDRYGISIEQYEEMVNNQAGRCKICHAEAKLHVDHDHVSGHVRGLLCNGCNRGIGYFSENSDALENAATYIRTLGSMVDY